MPAECPLLDHSGRFAAARRPDRVPGFLCHLQFFRGQKGSSGHRHFSWGGRVGCMNDDSSAFALMPRCKGFLCFRTYLLVHISFGSPHFS